MSHLGERIADFVFGEMTAAEAAEARRHIAQCEECRQIVTRFESTQAILRTSSDIEPPRPIIFEVQKPRFSWTWLVPSAVAAALLLAVLVAAPIQAQWNGFQLTITFGQRVPKTALAPVPQPQSASFQPPTSSSVQPVAEKLDYDKLQAWVNSQLASHDKAQEFNTQQLLGELQFIETSIEQTREENAETAANLQKVVQRRSSGD